MPLDALAVTAVLRRLASIDRATRSRVARLLGITEIEASAMLLLAGGESAAPETLQRELDLSEGGAAALIERLGREVLVRREPDPLRPRTARVRLSDEGMRELGAMLGPLADGLDALDAELADHERAIIARYLEGLAELADEFRVTPRAMSVDVI